MNTQTLDLSKLQGYLEDHIPGFSGELSAEKFAGGQSNPTFLLKTELLSGLILLLLRDRYWCSA